MSRFRQLALIIIVVAGAGLAALWFFRGGPKSPGGELVAAVQRGDETAVRALLEAGVNPDSVDRPGNVARIRAWITKHKHGYAPTIEHGRTALGFAATNESISRLLIDHGANLTAFDLAGYSPIHLSAMGENREAVALFLDRGVSIELPCRKPPGGHTPLILAAANGRTEIVQLLISRGANVNARAADGRTALIWAARWGNPDILRLLLAAGADSRIKDNSGLTALTSAQDQSRPDLERALSQLLSKR